MSDIRKMTRIGFCLLMVVVAVIVLASYIGHVEYERTIPEREENALLQLDERADLFEEQNAFYGLVFASPRSEEQVNGFTALVNELIGRGWIPLGSARLIGKASTYASSMNSASMLIQTLIRPEALQRQENLR